MITIYKYQLEVTDSQIVELPASAKLLSVQNQHEQLVLYALVNTEEVTTIPYRIIIHGTGHDASDVAQSNYLGTVQFHDGNLVFHIFYD